MKELKGKNYICTKDGHLNKDSIGWSRKTFNNCNISNGYFRRKIWNHYMWIDESFICAFAIVKLDYVGLIFIDLYDLKNNKEIHKSIQTPLSQGIFINPKIGSCASAKKHNTIINVLGVNNALNIITKWDNISIEANIDLEDESLNVLAPWNDKQYHYTSKQLPLKSNGYISLEDKKYYLDNSLTFIDYGRGIWEREKSWYWLTCGFYKDNKKIGLNLGGKWTDNTGVNENCIKIDEKIFKIYSNIDFKAMGMNKWNIRSIDSNEVDLVFTPIKMYDKVNNFMLVKSSLKQYIGKVSGVVKVSGEEIEIEDVLTWCEDHYTKW